MIGTIVGLTVAGATYLYARKRDVSSGASAVAAAGTGIGSGVATSMIFSLWPLALVGGALYYLGKKASSQPKALGPGSD